MTSIQRLIYWGPLCPGFFAIHFTARLIARYCAGSMVRLFLPRHEDIESKK